MKCLRFYSFVLTISVLSQLFFTPQAQAYITQKELYYGDKFESELHRINLLSNVESFYRPNYMSNEILLNFLHEVIKSAHVKRIQQPDLIVDNCENIESSIAKNGCFQHKVLGYDGARKIMFGSIDLRMNQDTNEYFVKDVYCNYEITNKNFGGENVIGPGLLPKNGNIVNTEHTWPQSRFTGQFNTEMQKSDLHHLFPTDSQMNSTRSSFRFGVVDQPQKTLKCSDSKFGRSSVDNLQVFEPPTHHKGNVARALFYFATRYKMKISPAEEFTLREWHNADPVDEEEMNRNNLIENVQGNRNPFIDFPELVERVQFFAFKNL